MISAKLERIGDRLALLLDDDALAALGARVGDTLHLEPAGDGALAAAVHETGAADLHARGRAFLRRYHRTLEPLA